MEEWTLEKNQNNKELEKIPASCPGDYYLLDEYMPNSRRRGYAIYKLQNAKEHAYIMVLADPSPDSLWPPVLISENETLAFLNDREKASTFATNIWLDRYR